MGHTKKILSSKKIASIPYFSTTKSVIEVAENIHFHYRNYRLEFDSYEFEQIAKSFIKGYGHWLIKGKPSSVRYKYFGDRNIFLASATIPSSPSSLNLKTNNGSIRVEIQQWTDYIHLHYKDFRFEFTFSEYNDFCETIYNSQDEFNKIYFKKDYPERKKFNQAAVPKEFSDYQKKSSYWTSIKDRKVHNPYESTYPLSEKDQLTERFSANENLFYLDIRDLYHSTLYNVHEENHFGVKNGTFLPLLNRYKFVDLVFQNNFNLNEKQIKESDYFILLSKKMDEKPRDGQSSMVYRDPMIIANNFIKLIKNIYENGYQPNKKHEINEVELINAENNISMQKNYKDKQIISVDVKLSTYFISNGLHRSAILFYLFQKGYINNPYILVQRLIKLDKKYFYDSRVKTIFPLRLLNFIKKFEKFIEDLFLLIILTPYYFFTYLKIKSINFYKKIKRKIF